MQTPKSKIGSLEVPPRKSPATPRTARQLKTSGPNSGTKNPPLRTPKTSPKVLDRRSPRSPVTEKKQPGRAVSELELQLAAARREAEEARGELRAVSARLEEISRCEDDRVLELRALSQERDKVWQSELEAVRRQHSMDSAALASAAAEIQKLKAQLERSAGLSEALEEASARAESLQGLVAELQAEAAGRDGELIRELEQSSARVRSLEALVGKLQAEVITGGERDSEEVKELRAELGSARSESARLRSALDAAEVRYQEEFIRSTLQIRSAYEQAERTRAEWAGLEAELRELRARAGELEARLLDKETELQSVSEENEGLRRCRAEEEEEKGQVAAEEARAQVEVEGELRRVKVQAEQWRKAAEAAAAMLSAVGGPLDGPIGSPCSDELDDDSPKKKNGNVLKKFGVLWKKGGQK